MPLPWLSSHSQGTLTHFEPNDLLNLRRQFFFIWAHSTSLVVLFFRPLEPRRLHQVHINCRHPYLLSAWASKRLMFFRRESVNEQTLDFSTGIYVVALHSEVSHLDQLTETLKLRS